MDQLRPGQTIFHLRGKKCSVSCEVHWMKLFSIPEAARFLRLNVKTVRKHVKDGRLEIVQTPVGVRIREEVLLAYSPFIQCFDEELDQDAPESTSPGKATTDQGEPIQTSLGHDRPDRHSPRETNVNQAEPSELSLALATAYKAMERSEKLEAQLEEERARSEQSEKRRLGLEVELGRYRCVLSENAESLAEERARRLQLEALEAENKRALEQWEAEKTELLEKVKLAETRVNWMEQRVPRWVRALFRAG